MGNETSLRKENRQSINENVEIDVRNDEKKYDLEGVDKTAITINFFTSLSLENIKDAEQKIELVCPCNERDYGRVGNYLGRVVMTMEVERRRKKDKILDENF